LGLLFLTPGDGGIFYGEVPMPSQAMRQALALARRGRGRTHPNPRVGAVVVRDGRVVGRGYHHAPGEPHAEVLALREAGPLSRGATLFVTLEPCRHTGRTPPCTAAIVQAGIAKVVIAVRDPHPVAGGGADELSRAGIRVEWHDGFSEALRENLPFFSWVVRHRPWVALKTALSADGRMAVRSGDTRYVTGEVARRDVHHLRNQWDAVLVGSGTVLQDDPALTCRGVPGGRDPVRVVLDSRGRLSGEERVFRISSPAPALVYTTETADVDYERRLFQAGAEVVRVGERDGHVHLPEVLQDLGERGLLAVLVEAGPTVQGSLVAEGLCDEWIAYWAPLVIGGTTGPVPVGGPGADRFDRAVGLAAVEVRRLGPDVRYRADVTTSWEELEHVLRHH
jgi:diaminohydroxyphosphoribosylaminopyrimidine deaminase/5-amino-6-(5-phosphoribosylamino)uracil reductase